MSSLFRSVILLSCVFAAAYGQSNLGLKYPLGVPLQLGSGMALSMGGASAGVTDDQNLMLRNPANLGSIDKTVFSSTLSFDFLNVKEGGAYSNFFTFVPEQLSLGFAVGAVGTVALSLDSRSDASAKYRFTAPSPAGAPNDSQQLALSRNGGLTVWELGWGHPIGKRVLAGLTYERAYLRMDPTKLATSFDNIDPYPSQVRDSSSIAFQGNGMRLGVMVPLANFTLGLCGEFFLKGTATHDWVTYSAVTTIDKGESEFNLRLPPSLTFGASYHPAPEWLAALDLSTVFWNAYTSDGVLTDPQINYASSFSAGAQFIPAPTLLSPRYWEQVHYRAGLRFTQLPALDNSEYLVSLGVGLPLRSNGLIDLLLQYGRRTDSRHSGYSEELFGFSIGVNGGRKWTKSSHGSY